MRANSKPDVAAGDRAPRLLEGAASLSNGRAPAMHACELGLPPSPGAAQLPVATSQSVLGAVLDAGKDGIYGLDLNGLITFANPSLEMMTGWSQAELVGQPQHAMLHRAQRSDSLSSPASCPACLTLSDGQAHSGDNQFTRKDGTCFGVAYTSTPILQERVWIGTVVQFEDVSRKKREETWEKKQKAIFSAITGNLDLDATLDMIAQAFADSSPGYGIALLTVPRSTSPTPAEDGLRLAAHAAIPESLQRAFPGIGAGEVYDEDVCLVDRDHQDRIFLCTRAAELGSELIATRNWDPLAGQEWMEFRSSFFGGCLAVPLLSSRDVLLGVAAFFCAGADAGAFETLAFVRGVCDLAILALEHRQLRAELVRQSHHDQLTGLPNRELVKDRLERALLHAKRYGTQLAVCSINLDQFKEINDTVGQATGDAVLRHVAKLLRVNLRDMDTVARQGGDEFVLIMPDVKGEAEADLFCERILAVLRQPVLVDDVKLSFTASMGSTIYPADRETASDLLQHADIALYAAKSSGKNRMRRFDSALGERHRREIQLQRELRLALERNQFHLAYQALYDGRRELKGFEALLRWTHPTLGVIGPDEFIPLAERSSQIVTIGEWVLNEACRQAREWNSISEFPVKIFVNISGVQLGEFNFTETIAGALLSTGLTPSLLNLEITETCIVADAKAASIRLKQLRELGVRISIDDFGCGHSTFSYLQQLPIDTLKIDRSFITCLDGTEKESAILRSIVALAEEMGLETIAEGVETGKQFDELQTTQCNLFQGFLLARPLAARDAQLLLTARVLTGGHETEALCP